MFFCFGLVSCADLPLTFESRDPMHPEAIESRQQLYRNEGFSSSESLEKAWFDGIAGQDRIRRRIVPINQTAKEGKP